MVINFLSEPLKFLNKSVQIKVFQVFVLTLSKYPLEYCNRYLFYDLMKKNLVITNRTIVVCCGVIIPALINRLVAKPALGLMAQNVGQITGVVGENVFLALFLRKRYTAAGANGNRKFSSNLKYLFQ